MDYSHSCPNAVICYHASDMRLRIDFDTAYLSITNAKSRGAGHFYLSNYPTNPVNPLVKKKGAILTQCTTIKRVMSSAAEAETAQVFNNTRAAIPIYRTVEEMNHSQKNPTFLKTDNKTPDFFAKSTVHNSTETLQGMGHEIPLDQRLYKNWIHMGILGQMLLEPC